jgi:hypothetical protein
MYSASVASIEGETLPADAGKGGDASPFERFLPFVGQHLLVNVMACIS